MKKTIAFVGVILLSLSSAALAAETIKNWSAPSTWTPPSAQATGGRSALLTTYSPLPFIPITPCRVADTRGNGFSGAYGPPHMVGGASRNFTITGQCGIPVGAQAVSFNFTVWNTLSFGDLKVYPTGGTVAAVSTLNWNPGMLALANAAVVPLGTSGQITTVNEGGSPIDLFIDVNGYYTGSVGTSAFVISSTGGYGIVGASTTNVGVWGIGQTHGVFGQDVSGGLGDGVYGLSLNGYGVRGLSSARNGVWAQSTNQDGLFASGGRDGAYIQGARFGAVGNSTGTTGQLFGLIGQMASTTTNAGAAGVRGVNAGGTLTDGFAHYASAGVQGVTGGPFGYGVLGVALGSPGIAGLFANQNTASPFAYTTVVALAPSNTLAASFTGNVSVSGTVSKGGGSFKIDHPLDPENKYLYHSFVESPDMMNIYNGIVTLNEFGEATVDLPDYFEALNSDFRYQLTSIGQAQANLYIADEVQDLKFRIAGGKSHARVSWQVTGIRKDAFANAHRIQVVEEKEKELRGTFMHPVEHGKAATRSEFFTSDGKPRMAGQRAPEEN